MPAAKQECASGILFTETGIYSGINHVLPGHTALHTGPHKHVRNFGKPIPDARRIIRRIQFRIYVRSQNTMFHAHVMEKPECLHGILSCTETVIDTGQDMRMHIRPEIHVGKFYV